MLVPQWVSFVIAAVVTAFGVYRIYLAITVDSARNNGRGLYRLGRRTHVLFGILYLLLGAFVLASGFGFRPFG